MNPPPRWTRGDYAVLAFSLVLFAGTLATTFQHLGYDYEGHFPYLLQIPESIRGFDVDADGGARTQWSHPPREHTGGGVSLVSGTEWPTFSLQSDAWVLPILTESYQAGWPYWIGGLVPRGESGLWVVRLLGILVGCATLLVVFALVLRTWGSRAARIGVVVLAVNNVFVMLCGRGTLFETLQFLFFPLTLLYAVRASRLGRPAAAFFLGVLAGTFVGLKLTAGLCMAAALLAALPWSYWRSLARSCAFLAGAAVPLFPYLAHEILRLQESPDATLGMMGRFPEGGLPGLGAFLTSVWDSLGWALRMPFGDPKIAGWLFGDPDGGVWILSALGVAWGALVLALCLRAIARRRTDPLMRATLAAALALVVQAGLLYRRETDFHSTLPIIPMLAVLGARPITEWLGDPTGGRWSSRPRVVAALALVPLVLSLWQAGVSVAHSRECGATPFCAKAQFEVIQRIPADRAVVLMHQAQFGMLEFLSERPVHTVLVEEALFEERLDLDRAVKAGRMVATWRRIFGLYPDAVYLLSEGESPFDSSAPAGGDAVNPLNAVKIETFLEAARSNGVEPRRLGGGSGMRGGDVLGVYELPSTPGLR